MLEGPTFTVYCQQPGEVWCLPSSSCWFLSPQCLPLVCVYVFLLLPSFSVFCLFVHSDILSIGRFKRSANVSIFYLCLLQFMLSMLLMTGSQKLIHHQHLQPVGLSAPLPPLPLVRFIHIGTTVPGHCPTHLPIPKPTQFPAPLHLQFLDVLT